MISKLTCVYHKGGIPSVTDCMMCGHADPGSLQIVYRSAHLRGPSACLFGWLPAEWPNPGPHSVHHPSLPLYRHSCCLILDLITEAVWLRRIFKTIPCWACVTVLPSSPSSVPVLLPDKQERQFWWEINLQCLCLAAMLVGGFLTYIMSSWRCTKDSLLCGDCREKEPRNLKGGKFKNDKMDGNP